MTNFDVIAMAREAGAMHIHMKPKEFALVGNETIKRFAALIAAAERDKWMERTAVLIRGEREACAGECDEWVKNGSALAEDIACAIRARSNK